MQHFFPSYRITIADIPRIKAVAARVFGREVPTQTRLEILARGAGFKTYAGFLAALHKAPIFLSGDQAKEQHYIDSSVPETICPPFYKGVSLTDMVAAGLAWSERLDVLGATQQTPAEKLAAVKRSAGTDNDFLHFMWPKRTKEKTRNVYMSSIPKTEALARFSANLVVVASPANQLSYGREYTNRPWLVAKGQHKPDSDFWINRGDAQHLAGMDPQSVQSLLSNTRVFLFDEQDLADFRHLLNVLGLASLNVHTQIVKPTMLDIQRRTHGTFHHIATAISDKPDEEYAHRGADWVERRSIEGLFDMTDQVVGIAYERHLMATPAEGETKNYARCIDPLLVAEY